MFGRSTPFSAAVADFDSNLDQLTWNNGNLIMDLTAKARDISPSDHPVIVACIVFRIITNPVKSKLPVFYVLDSIVKNVPTFTDHFEPHLVTLFSSIFDIIDQEEDRAPLLKLLAAWITRGAFPAASLSALQQAILASSSRRSMLPYSSGWPLHLPPGTESFPAVELQISSALYTSLLPLVQVTIDELHFTKDAVASLHSLLQQIRPLLGRPGDPEIDKLLEQYELIKKYRHLLSSSGDVGAIQPGGGIDPRGPNESQNYAPNPSYRHPEHLHHHQPEHHQPDHMYNNHQYGGMNLNQGDASMYGQGEGMYEGGRSINERGNERAVQGGGVRSPSPPKWDADVPTVSISLKDFKSLKKFNQAAIDAIYKDLPFQCSTCGLRFVSNDLMTKHLNWHYFEKTAHNTRSSGKSQATSKLYRQWYLSASDWVDTCGASAEQKQESTSTALNAPSSSSTNDSSHQSLESAQPRVYLDAVDQDIQVLCGGCGEDIDSPKYDETLHEWYYPNTLKGLDGKLYHPNCIPPSQIDPSIRTNGASPLAQDVAVAHPSREPSTTDENSSSNNNTKKRQLELSDSTLDSLLVDSPASKKVKLEETS